MLDLKVFFADWSSIERAEPLFDVQFFKRRSEFFNGWQSVTNLTSLVQLLQLSVAEAIVREGHVTELFKSVVHFFGRAQSEVAAW